jgi:hypothetical protein
MHSPQLQLSKLVHSCGGKWSHNKLANPYDIILPTHVQGLFRPHYTKWILLGLNVHIVVPKAYNFIFYSFLMSYYHVTNMCDVSIMTFQPHCRLSSNPMDFLHQVLGLKIQCASWDLMPYGYIIRIHILKASIVSLEIGQNFKN